MKEPKRIAVIIVAAGAGARAASGGDTTPKQYRKVGGKPVLQRTIEAFLAGNASWVVTVIHPDHRGHGYGAMLVDYVVDFAKRKNFKRITLLTDRMSEETQAFFKKQGFEHSNMIPMRRIIN